MKSICLIANYFGEWPPWFDMFLESVRYNRTIDWCIYTDCPIPEDPPLNVRFLRTDFASYCDMVSAKLGVCFQPDTSHNLCKLRPMYGEIHAADIEGYDYFGWSDLDVIFGDVRSIYTDEILTHNVISAEQFSCSGPFTLIKNEPWLKSAYRHIHAWQGHLESPGGFSWAGNLDEAHLGALFCPDEPTRLGLGELTGTRAPTPMYYSNSYFRRQWSTPFSPNLWLDGSRRHPETWFWHNGVLSNDQDGPRQFLFLHFLNFKAKTWVDEELYGQALTWTDLPECMHFTLQHLRARPPAERRVMIDRTGLHLCP
jgi:hypothetical protein